MALFRYTYGPTSRLRETDRWDAFLHARDRLNEAIESGDPARIGEYLSLYTETLLYTVGTIGDALENLDRRLEALEPPEARR